MKKLIVYILILSLLLCGCGKQTSESDPALLEYPGLKWGMTFDEVQNALGFTDADVLSSSPGEPIPEGSVTAVYHNYSVGNLEVFGFPARLVVLRFHEYAGHEPGLAELVVYFPDGYDGAATTDTEALRMVLTEYYGEKAETVRMVRWDDLSGDVQRDEYPYPGDDPCYWVSKITAKDLLSKEQLQKLHTISNTSRAEARPDSVLPDYEQFCQSQENAAVTLNLRTLEEGDYLDWVREQGGTGLVLTFDAQLVVHTMAIDRYDK